jgi:2-iminobutanoate/2-iminopropanoate deaminase
MTGSDRRWTPVTLGGEIPLPKGAYSPAVRVGDLLFVSGQVPRNPRTGEIEGKTVAEQTRRVLANLRLVLEAGGGTLEDVVAMNCYLADERDWDAFNAEYKSVFKPPYPTRTTVGVGLRDVLVEVSAIAWLGPSRSTAQ